MPSMEDTGPVSNNSSMQHPPPLHPLQEKLQKLAKDNPRKLVDWSRNPRQIVPLFKVDETLRYAVSTSYGGVEGPLYHDQYSSGLNFHTLHYRSGEVSQDVPRDSHIEKYYEDFLEEPGKDHLSFSENDALFEPEVLKTHDTLKIRSRELEDEKDVDHDAVFATLGWLIEIHDDPNIAEEDRVLITNYVVLLNPTTDPVSMWVRTYLRTFFFLFNPSLRVMSQELAC